MKINTLLFALLFLLSSCGPDNNTGSCTWDQCFEDQCNEDTNLPPNCSSGAIHDQKSCEESANAAAKRDGQIAKNIKWIEGGGSCFVE